MEDESAAARDLVDTDKLIAQLKSIPEFQPLKPKQRRFIFAYIGCGQVTKASVISSVNWVTHYNWFNRDPNYSKAWDRAREMFADYAEGDVFQRAFYGVEKTVTRYRANGDVVTEKQIQKSDILAMFALKGLRPQYRDNWQVNNFVGPSQLNIGYSSPPPAIDVSPNSDQLKKLNDNKD